VRHSIRDVPKREHDRSDFLKTRARPIVLSEPTDETSTTERIPEKLTGAHRILPRAFIKLMALIACVGLITAGAKGQEVEEDPEESLAHVYETGGDPCIGNEETFDCLLEDRDWTVPRKPAVRVVKAAAAPKLTKKTTKSDREEERHQELLRALNAIRIEVINSGH
jgi:hypothetical protein